MSIEIRDLHFVYHRGTPLESAALAGIDLVINKAEWLSIVGHTGSGKSTLAQHLNALLVPHQGQVLVDGISTSGESSKLRNIRQKVGLVFQYPEQQLFAETVYDEVAFAPLNWGIKAENLEDRVSEALNAAGLGPEFKNRNPFQLSGGEKRRVAIASVLAARPSYLVLDEPTAGLDSRGKNDLLSLLASMREEGMGIILITHDLELALSCSERILVIENGKAVISGSSEKVIYTLGSTMVNGLIVPEIAKVAQGLRNCGWDVPLSIDETDIAEAIVKRVRDREIS